VSTPTNLKHYWKQEPFALGLKTTFTPGYLDYWE